MELIWAGSLRWAWSFAANERRRYGLRSAAVETDHWRAAISYRAYVGQRLGLPQSFYVQPQRHAAASGAGEQI